MDYTEEQLSIAFDKLPHITQDVVFTPKIGQALKPIEAPLEILSDSAITLYTLTNIAILKLIDEKEFAEKLITTLGVSVTVAQKITSEVFSQIINPIRLKETEEMTRSLKIEGGEEAEETPDEEIVTAGAAPANIPTAVKEEPLMPPLIPKVITPKEVAPEIPPVHPFEQKLQGTFTNTPTPTSTPMPATFAPAAVIIPQVPQSIPIVSTPPSAPVVPQALSNMPVTNPTQTASPRGTLTHDPYREPVE